MLLKANAAIVSTVRDAEPHLETWIIYHLSIGFKYLFLFFDDPEDPSIIKYSNLKNVVIIVSNDALKETWKKIRFYKKFEPFIATEVMARQVLNANVALKMALEMEVEWLLHIDSDEIFFSPEISVAEHFSYLNSIKVNHLTYNNHEAIPELTPITDCFKEIKLFKRNKADLTEWQLNTLNNNKADENYFNYYDNGKSAVKVSQFAVAFNCHEFMFLIAKTTFSPKKNTYIRDKPCVLHYPCCSFEFFYKKYKILGFFNNKWFNVNEISYCVPNHIKARDVYKSADLNLMKEFYNETFSNRYLTNKDVFIKDGIYFRADLAI